MGLRLRTDDPVVHGHPLNRDRVAWYEVMPWLAGGPTWFDLVGGFNTPVIGGVWTGPAPGGFGSLTNSGGHDLQAYPPPFPTTAFSSLGYTVAGWANPSTNSGIQGLFSDNPGFIFIGFNNGYPYCQGYGYSSIKGTTSGVNRWNHLLASVSPVGTSFYVNGILLGFNPSSTSIHTPTGFRFMGYPGYSSYDLIGSAAGISIWSRPMGANEAFAQYHEALSGYPNTLARRRVPRLKSPIPSNEHGEGSGSASRHPTISSIAHFLTAGFDGDSELSTRFLLVSAGKFSPQILGSASLSHSSLIVGSGLRNTTHWTSVTSATHNHATLIGNATSELPVYAGLATLEFRPVIWPQGDYSHGYFVIPSTRYTMTTAASIRYVVDPLPGA
jgi:hypothetical protein